MYYANEARGTDRSSALSLNSLEGTLSVQKQRAAGQTPQTHQQHKQDVMGTERATPYVVVSLLFDNVYFCFAPCHETDSSPT